MSNAGLSHKGFITTSTIFIVLNAVSMVFELGFNWIVVRLPEGDYGVYGRLFNIFFLITVPLLVVQLMVSKEVSSLYATGNKGQARYFIEQSLKYIIIGGLAITAAGLAASSLIANLLSIESVTPVVLLMLITCMYIPVPVLIGTSQGLKRFYTIGFLAIAWGLFRFSFGLMAILILPELNSVLTGIIVAVFFTLIISFLCIKHIFTIPSVKLGKHRLKRAYSFVVPIGITLFLITELRSIDLVVAGRFFDDALVDAYTCAVQIGKGFFMLTGIIMIMFPLVSAENSLNRNPIKYLAKSLLVMVFLSAIGIALSWFAPEFVMKVITGGKYIEGAESLIRIIGIVILPVSIIYITANYYLAQHIAGFIPILIGGMILQWAFILFFHTTPYQMLFRVGCANYITLFSLIPYFLVQQRKHKQDYSI
ncbi:MAG: hypothetical protein JXB48_13880 [Candidatus Latescibacteria bacterium]|nr:hypothetical protein [Candidatus Latescibacterota bacterium]